MSELDVKICGLSTPDSIKASLSGGATHLGFIFFEKSPRNVTPQAAADLAANIGDEAVIVAVTVDADDDFLDEIVAAVDPGILQLHGKETPERVCALKEKYKIPVMKAFAIRESSDLEKIKPWLAVADKLLLDAKPPAGSDLPGGNGVAFDWSILDSLDREVSYMLSGGINIDNVEDALKLSNAGGLDVSSGVESSPGIKDNRQIAEFLEKVGQLANNKAA
ncbi:MAG: phosphoribosylanthranilate isomerase [Pseudomonadota bacterium]